LASEVEAGGPDGFGFALVAEDGYYFAEFCGLELYTGIVR
jgi:hypothetical protein